MKDMNKIRILLADDHIMFREGLERVLNETEDISVIDAVGDGAGVLKKIETEQFDVLVLDIAMPGLGGIDVLRILKKKKTDIKVLVLSMYSPEQYAIRVLKAGAVGYLTKGSHLSELLFAIRSIAKGKKYINDELTNLLSNNILDDVGHAPHDLLSTREYQVLCHLAQARTVSEIGELLSLSSKTISTYRTRILNKLNMKNNSELAHYVFIHGLIS